jgi:hypothetical protein
MAHDVFVSHSSKDKPTADAVCAMLESQGIRCWVAPRDIVPGMDWGEAIVHAVKGARVMVLVFSASANDSPQIKREVERAVNKGIPVIPLRIEDVAPTASLEYFISTPHWLDAFTPPLEGHLRYLAQIIQQILGSQPATDAANAPRAPVVPPSGPRAVPEMSVRDDASVVKTQSRRAPPPVVLLAGALALLAVLLAGWWFGIERPRREESRELIARLAHERQQRSDAEEVAKRADEKRKAEAEAARLAQERRDAAQAIKEAEEKRKEDERIAEIKRQKENEEARERDRLASLPPEKSKVEEHPKTFVAEIPEATQPTNTPAVAPVKRALTAFELAKEAERYISEPAKGKLVKAHSMKSFNESTPSAWALLFHDPTTAFETVEVSFRSGQMTAVKFPPDYFGAKLGIRPRPFDKKQLNVDSDKAMEMALKEPLLDHLTLKASEVWLDWRDGVPAWRIKLWAAKSRNPNAEADLGEIILSADDGRIIRRDLHPERVN